MAKKKMICPFSGKLCRECSMFRGRHYFLCFDRKYRGSIDIDRTKVELPKELPQLVAGQRMPRVEDLKSLSIKGGNETIFIVDDDKVMRDYCETNLNTFGYQIVTASGEEALTRFLEKKNDIALAVLDFNISSFSFSDLINNFRRLKPNLKVILSIENSLDEAMKEVKEVKVFSLIQKPYTTITLARIVRDALDSKV